MRCVSGVHPLFFGGIQPAPHLPRFCEWSILHSASFFGVIARVPNVGHDRAPRVRCDPTRELGRIQPPQALATRNATPHNMHAKIRDNEAHARSGPMAIGAPGGQNKESPLKTKCPHCKAITGAAAHLGHLHGDIFMLFFSAISPHVHRKNNTGDT